MGKRQAVAVGSQKRHVYEAGGRGSERVAACLCPSVESTEEGEPRSWC